MIRTEFIFFIFVYFMVRSRASYISLRSWKNVYLSGKNHLLLWYIVFSSAFTNHIKSENEFLFWKREMTVQLKFLTTNLFGNRPWTLPCWLTFIFFRINRFGAQRARAACSSEYFIKFMLNQPQTGRQKSVRNFKHFFLVTASQWSHAHWANREEIWTKLTHIGFDVYLYSCELLVSVFAENETHSSLSLERYLSN